MKLKASGGAGVGGESGNVPAGWERREWGMKKKKVALRCDPAE